MNPSKKQIQLVLSVFSIVFLQLNGTFCFAAARLISPEDLSTVEAVDSIEKCADDEASVNGYLLPLMANLAHGITKDPSNLRLRFILAMAYRKIGMEELAEDELQEAKKSGQAYKDFLRAALKRKVLASEFSQAMTYYALVKEFYPDDPSVAIMRSLQLRKEGKLAEEEKLLQSLISAGSKELGLASALASLSFEKGNYDESLKLFDRDLTLDAAYEPAVLGKAKTLERMGRYGESLALSIPLFTKEAQRAELALLVANGFCHLGAYKDALAPSLVALGVALKKEQLDKAKRLTMFLWPRTSKKQQSEALFEVSQLLDKTIFGARMHFALGDALQKAGYINEAERQFRQGLKFEPRHDRAYLHLAEIYQYHYKEPKTAVLHYLMYNRFSGGNRFIEQRVARLNSRAQIDGDIALRIKQNLERSFRKRSK